MNDRWIVVADASRARIFEQTGKGAALNEVATFTHPESRLHPGDLRTGGKGEYFEDNNPDTRTLRQSAPDNTAKETEAERFAREVCEHLDKARSQGAFESLVLIAEPQFLGRLRGQLSDPTGKLVEASVDKNWVEDTAAVIQERLSRH